MKTRIVIATLFFTIIAVSCDKTGVKPEIDFHELGYENSKTAEAGDELHLDAEIVAENKIDRIEVELHPEGDEHKKLTRIVLSEEHWEFDSIYTEFEGLKNTEFHKHIEIPLEAETGDYHFHFSVTDLEGNQTVFEDEVEILAPAAK